MCFSYESDIPRDAILMGSNWRGYHHWQSDNPLEDTHQERRYPMIRPVKITSVTSDTH